MAMALIPITMDKYNDFRLDAIFSACKWDPCVADNNTLSNYVLVLDKSDAEYLEKATEELSYETIEAENFLKYNNHLAKDLCLPRYITKHLNKLACYNPKEHVRLMRFDFHPTTEGYKISEVNSDVPAGFAEASRLNELGLKYLEDQNLGTPRNFGNELIVAIKKHVKSGESIACIHCTAYSDDRQVVQYIGDRLQENLFNSVFIGADCIEFRDKKAFSILKGNETKLGGMVRVFPIEWLKDLPKCYRWTDYFTTTTMCCNHAVAIYTQTKRFPLVWDKLEKHGLRFDMWRKLLPNTYDPKDVNLKTSTKEYIIKPALGRVGEDVTIEGTMPQKNIDSIKKLSRRYPKHYIAQEKFKSVPVLADNGIRYHICIGAFSVNGKFAGLYGRLSLSPRMDRNAIDAAVVIR